VHHLHYGTALKDGQVALIELMGLLVSAVSAALHAPSPQHVHMVRVLVSGTRWTMLIISCGVCHGLAVDAILR
jgi:hypothetical protein